MTADAFQPETRVELCADEPFVMASRRIGLNLFRRLQTGPEACDRSSERHGCVAGHGDRTGGDFTPGV